MVSGRDDYKFSIPLSLKFEEWQERTHIFVRGWQYKNWIKLPRFKGQWRARWKLRWFHKISKFVAPSERLPNGEEEPSKYCYRILFVLQCLMVMWSSRILMPYSGMWRRVNLVWTGVSEERMSSIFKVEESASEGPVRAGGCRLKTEAIRSSETSGHKSSAWRHIQEDDILHSHHRKNLKSYIEEY
jgi:hypothetical protein